MKKWHRWPKWKMGTFFKTNKFWPSTYVIMVGNYHFNPKCILLLFTLFCSVFLFLFFQIFMSFFFFLFLVVSATLFSNFSLHCLFLFFTFFFPLHFLFFFFSFFSLCFFFFFIFLSFPLHFCASSIQNRVWSIRTLNIKWTSELSIERRASSTEHQVNF